MSRLLDPVLFVLVALGASLWCLGRSPNASRSDAARVGGRARAVAWASFAALWLASSPWAANVLASWIQPRPVDPRSALEGIDPSRAALVVLSAGMKTSYASVPIAERLDDQTQARVLGAARIYRERPLARVVISTYARAPANAMTGLLVEQGIGRDRVVADVESTDTRTNAQNSVRIVRALGLDRIVLVTSALHMPRAVAEFRAQGVDVMAAPVDYRGGDPPSFAKLLPSSSAMLESNLTVHEILGRFEPW